LEPTSRIAHFSGFPFLWFLCFFGYWLLAPWLSASVGFGGVCASWRLAVMAVGFCGLLAFVAFGFCSFCWILLVSWFVASMAP